VIRVAADQAKAQLVRRAHKYASVGDVANLLTLCTPEVEFTTFLGQMEGRTYHGQSGVSEWIENLHSTFSDFENQVLEIDSISENAVIAEVLIGGTASGLRLEERLFQLVSFRGGLASAWAWYRTREEAVAAAEAGE
jgi:ketosteroid isomerase-like protein